MLTDGLRMRLNRSDFDPLLKEPLLNRINEQQAASRIEEGGVLIDVRLEDEFCDAGQRSATAAFLLGIKGPASSAIRGVIDSCRRLPATRQ